MKIEGLEAIIDLIEIGAIPSNKDIAKCLRSAVAAIKERISTENAHERKWVSLTDDQIKEIIGPYEGQIKGYTRALFDKIDAKLRENNT